jgi:hypothetical protein
MTGPAATPIAAHPAEAWLDLVLAGPSLALVSSELGAQVLFAWLRFIDTPA